MESIGDKIVIFYYYYSSEITDVKIDIRIKINNNNNHSDHLLISLYISVPHTMQSQSTLCNHQSTHLPLLPLLIPVNGWLMALLLL